MPFDSALQPMDYVGPFVGAGVFIGLMSRVPEPARREINAVLVIGASGVYMSGGFGPWELVYAAVAGPLLGYFALRSYYVIGLAWLMHAAWDFMHHMYGAPIWPFKATSSFGCMLFDTLIAVWFLAQARPRPRACAKRGPSSSARDALA